jgi:hypothetical protein
MTKRLACPPAPGPLEDYAAQFDALFSSLAQRRGLRAYLQGLLLPRDRNKTLTALAGAEPVVGAQHAAVQVMDGPGGDGHQNILLDALGRVESIAQPDGPIVSISVELRHTPERRRVVARGNDP